MLRKRPSYYNGIACGTLAGSSNSCSGKAMHGEGGRISYEWDRFSLEMVFHHRVPKQQRHSK